MLKIIFKLLFKLFTPVLIILGISAYGLSMQGQDPMKVLEKIGINLPNTDVNLNSILPSQEHNLASPDVTFSNVNHSSKPKARGMYRWKDAKGKTHYGDTPPRDAKQIVHVAILKSTTKSSSHQKTVKKTQSQSNVTQRNTNQSTQLNPNDITTPVDVYNPKNIQKLMQEAQRIRGSIDKRNQQLYEQIEQVNAR